mgnify:CR=1 FL=1
MSDFRLEAQESCNLPSKIETVFNYAKLSTLDGNYHQTHPRRNLFSLTRPKAWHLEVVRGRLAWEFHGGDIITHKENKEQMYRCKKTSSVLLQVLLSLLTTALRVSAASNCRDPSGDTQYNQDSCWDKGFVDYLG